MLIDTVVCLTLAKWETVSAQFGGYLMMLPPVSGVKMISTVPNGGFPVNAKLLSPEILKLKLRRKGKPGSDAVIVTDIGAD